MNSGYDVVCKKQAENCAGSMPLGGCDVGCNVWVENGRLMLYAAQSGAFDEEGRMLKAGRFCICPGGDFFAENFSQRLNLREGCIELAGRGSILLWVEAQRPVLHIRIRGAEAEKMWVRYELWRGDAVEPADGRLLFFHENRNTHLLEDKLAEQGIESLKAYFPDAEKGRVSGGLLAAPGTVFAGVSHGRYLENDFTAWRLETPGSTAQLELTVCLRTAQEKPEAFRAELEKLYGEAAADAGAAAEFELRLLFSARPALFVHRLSGTACAG